MSLATQKTLESSYVMRTFGRSEVEFVGGRGMTLVDAEGREYLDFWRASACAAWVTGTRR